MRFGRDLAVPVLQVVIARDVPAWYHELLKRGGPMGLFGSLFGGGRSNSNRSGYSAYRTKSGTTIKQGSGGKIFTSRSTTKSGGSKSTTYWYDKRRK